jgi:dTDP-4-dehydrorhamnose 3,5-epimerase
MFRDGIIDDVIIRDIPRHTDRRGWLMELFRRDELPDHLLPAMAYVSVTEPGIARGPHEHRDQADLFCFLGPSNFTVYLWDARPVSPTRGTRQVFLAGEGSPRMVVVPAGVVHAYKNIGDVPGMVFNAPNRLFAGEGRKEPVDEIRHESDPDSPFVLP